MDKLKEYADVVLTTGINLKKNQKLNIGCSYGNYDFARLIAERAYLMGAGFVNIDIKDNYLIKARADNHTKTQLEYFPLFSQVHSAQLVSEEWAYISIDNTDENDVLKEADSDKIQTLVKTSRRGRDNVLTAMMSDKIAWSIVAYPNKKWAEQVLGKGATINELWELLKPILRLDQDNPVTAWRSHSDKFTERAKKLSKMKISSLRFRDRDNTDLTVGIPDDAIWHGGAAVLPDGRSFMPNIPTEETFTTPDRLRTEGFVKIRKPLQVLEKTVNGAWFKFSRGKVVEFGAETGKEILEKFLKIDDGAEYLGEIALVDGSSKISESGKLFNSILFDENASSHMALGFGFADSFEKGGLLTEEQLLEAGCNKSLVHIDFMIGASDTLVTAIDILGNEITIMKEGLFVI